MRVRVAGLVDECPGASTKGAKGAEGELQVTLIIDLTTLKTIVTSSSPVADSVLQ